VSGGGARECRAKMASRECSAQSSCRGGGYVVPEEVVGERREEHARAVSGPVWCLHGRVAPLAVGTCRTTPAHRRAAWRSRGRLKLAPWCFVDHTVLTQQLPVSLPFVANTLRIQMVFNHDRRCPSD